MTVATTERERDPFRTQTNVTRAAEAVEDALDEIAKRFDVTFFVDNSCCGCSSGMFAVESNKNPDDVAYVQETPNE